MGNRASHTERISHDGLNENDRPSTREDSSRTPSVSYYTLLKNSYQALVNAIIRPPRCQYDSSQLGPRKFHFAGKNFQRTDLTLTNNRNMRIECSWWEPAAEERPAATLPCVIYMHGNSSARVESVSCLSVVLSLGATLFSLDFCGSGQSEGEYVSLGAFEKDDLQAVIEHLRGTERVSTIALWGRSMGAATALLHGERDPSIAAMVLDSAFADLVMLAEEMVEKGRQQGLFAPGLLVKIAIKFVRGSVQKTAGFDIKTLSPIEHADKCFIPALFVAAEGDNFVMPTHSQKIYDKYGGDKNIILVEGDHNSPRPRYLYDSISIFLQSTLQVPYEWLLHAGQQYTRRAPWTYSQPSLQDAAGLGALSLDELMALSLMEEYGGAGEEDLAMQQNLQDSLYGLLSGQVSNKSNAEGVEGRPASSSIHSANGMIRSYDDKPNEIPPACSTSANDESRLPVLLNARKIKLSSESQVMPLDSTSHEEVMAEISWACPACTFVNNLADEICEACGIGTRQDV